MKKKRKVAVPLGGLSKHPLYNCWYQMIVRCYDKEHHGYHRYGGRDIKVCFVWRDDFLSFYLWAIEAGWKSGLQIDRRDNNGNYCPSNCRFVTSKKNSNNRGFNRLFEFKGQQKTISEWAETYNINYYTLWSRIQRGWSFKKSLLRSIRKGRVFFAYGESKTMVEWGKDKRCKVSYKVFESRILKGWKIKRALRTPLGKSTKGLRMIAINGEIKSLMEWSKDPRCEVPYSTFQARLNSGKDPLKSLKR